ncbi:MAG TPA: adenylate kinase [Methanomicrobiales archaeon]|nr:adenylate kinase [Methanomicrobiales archaeon]
MGKRVVITGVPGVGKTTVVNGALGKLAGEGIMYQSINFGTVMFEVACAQKVVSDRDGMRKLPGAVQREIQRNAAQAIARTEGNIIIDTHCTVKTPKGFLAGLPEWVLRELMPDMVILVETDEDQILARRLNDPTRTRDPDSAREIALHQEYNRAMAAAYSMVSGCTVKIVKNQDFLLERAVADMAEALR